MYNEIPLGMSEEEWVETLINSYFSVDCPNEIKDAFLEQNGFNFADEIHNEIWHNMPKYIKEIRTQAQNEGRIVMYTPESMVKITRCINIVKQIANLSNLPIEIQMLPVSTTFAPANFLKPAGFVAEIEELSLDWEDKSKNLFEELMTVADNISVHLNYNEDSIAITVNFKDAVIIQKI